MTDKIDYTKPAGMRDSRFKVTKKLPRYNHIVWVGTFTGEPTLEELEKAFYDEYFGGRSPYIDREQKRFQVIEHTD